MAKKQDEDPYGWNPWIARESERGIKIQANPQSSFPQFAGREPEPELRDRVMSALMGFGKSMEAATQAAQLGDPLLASLAAIGGSVQQPGPQALANQRQQMQIQQQMAQFEAMPVDQVSPDLVAKFPYLKGLPLGIVNRIAPLIQRSELFELAEQGKNQRAEVSAGRQEVKDERATRTEERQLRNELQAKSKDFVTIRDNFARLKEVAKTATPAGDLSMIFSYMKLLDPGSVVRETEFKNAETAAPLLTRWGLDFNKVGSVWSGKKLTPEMRADFLTKATELYRAQEAQHNQTRSEYRRLAEVAGGKAENVDVIGGAAPVGGMVQMVSPGGKIGFVPADKADAAEKKGYRRIR